MTRRLLAFDYVFWYATILCQLVACLALIKRREFLRHWKVFSYYIFYMAGAMIFTLAVERFGSPTAFAATYSVVDFIEAILLNLVIIVCWVAISLAGRHVALLLSPLFMLGCMVLWLALIWTAWQDSRLVLPVIGPMAEKQA